jgi:hypothetical protein
MPKYRALNVTANVTYSYHWAINGQYFPVDRQDNRNATSYIRVPQFHILAQKSVLRTRVISGIPQSIQVNARLASQIRPRFLSLFTLFFNSPFTNQAIIGIYIV